MHRLEGSLRFLRSGRSPFRRPSGAVRRSRPTDHVREKFQEFAEQKFEHIQERSSTEQGPVRCRGADLVVRTVLDVGAEERWNLSVDFNGTHKKTGPSW